MLGFPIDRRGLGEEAGHCWGSRRAVLVMLLFQYAGNVFCAVDSGISPLLIRRKAR